MKRTFLILVMTCGLVLSACGGGGGGDGGGGGGTGSSPPPMPTGEQLQDAQYAMLAAGFDVSSGAATLTWTDTFPPGTTYIIQQQTSSGTWTQLDTVAGTGSDLVPLSWTHTFSTATTLRVVVQESGYVVPLETSKQQTSLEISLTTDLPTLGLSQPQPLTSGGTVIASISGGGNYLSATYYLDANLIDKGVKNGPDFSIGINATNLANGTHQLLVQLATGATTSLEVSLIFQVSVPPPPEITLTEASQQLTTGGIQILVTATSGYPITSVSGSWDGQSLGTQQSPNSTGQYAFTVSASDAASGTHTFVAQATDGNGVTESQSFNVVVINPPIINVTSPVPMTLANGGSLLVTGTVASDVPGLTFTVTATLGDLPISITGGASFSGSLNIAGLAPGTYPLQVEAVDSSPARAAQFYNSTVIVTASPSLAYPAFRIGTGVLSSVGGKYFVYQASDGSMHLRSPSGDVTLQTSDLGPSSLGSQVSDAGYAFVYPTSTGTSAPAPGTIYMFSPTGARTNLSAAAGTSNDQLQSVHYPWVLWTTLSQTNLVLYNISSGQQFTIPGPAHNSVDDFCILNGQLTVFYASGTGGGTATVMRWDQSTNSSAPIGVASSSTFLQTDGVRAVWVNNENLTTLDLASNTTQVVSTSTAGNFSLSDGILSWVEASGELMASDSTTITTLSTVSGDTLYGASGGYAIFQEAGKILAWSPSGSRQDIFDPVPGTTSGIYLRVFPGGKTIYFDLGDGFQTTLYSTTLP
jgi:hypothetical protein